MKRKLTLGITMVASMLMAPACWAQAPAIPAAPAAPAPANIWSFLLPNAEQKLACKTAFCNSPLGKMTSGAAGPMGMMSGGLLGGRCAQNAIANDAKKAAESPGGAAGRIKADEEEAKERRLAVRFLGTVDCNYWPEAIEALKTALRKDRNECVRFEAALALRNGCCCNNEIIDALTNSVLGENKKDPAPAERSERVRAAAAEALARCPIVQKDTPPDDKLVKADLNTNVDPAEYYKKVAQKRPDEVAANARAVLVSLQKASATAPPVEGGGISSVHATAPVPQRSSTLAGIVMNAFSSDPPSPGPRQPFFSHLTRTLTGKQDYIATARHEYSAPVPVGGPVIREFKPSDDFIPPTPSPAFPSELPGPGTLPEKLPTLPAVKPLPLQPSNRIPAETQPKSPSTDVPAPRSGAIRVIDHVAPAATPSVQPPVGKVHAPLEIVQPAPRAVAVLGQPRSAPGLEIVQPPPLSDRPRESRGIVTMEEILPAPIQRP